MAKEGLRVGLHGGTFNPIHFGHLRVAEEIAEILKLDKVFFIPASRPPHKDPSPLAALSHRLEMVRLAITNRPGFFLSDVEGRRQGSSYTVETLEHFQREYGPEASLFFITGLDSFLEVHTWKDYHRLFQLAEFVVVTRPGYDPGLLEVELKNRVSPIYTWHPQKAVFTCPEKRPVHFHPVSRLDISSSDIRARLAQGRSVRYLLPEQVREYILRNALYLSDNHDSTREADEKLSALKG